ncbi:hypothetical protein [Actinoplanes sp. TBRC 11911]|uniref:hypothetical protein n=1 Tax=Actinoplanes sp. TBRC 11911 TaxID=2729386 RepID=UPI001B7D5300|nr:hypothetical protein [Actinoplanes sp. TBRC 11911]
MGQLQLFSAAQLAVMRDTTKRRNYSAEAEEFRVEHARHRRWGLAQRHARKLRRLYGQVPDDAEILAAWGKRAGAGQRPSPAGRPAPAGASGPGRLPPVRATRGHPVPADPRPELSAGSNGRPAAAELTDFVPTDPEPAEPEPREPEAVEPEPADPKPREPKPREPEPEPGEPEPRQPEAVEPEPGEPEPREPKPREPEPEPGEPEPRQPEAVEPEPGEPEPREPEPGDSAPGDSEAGELEPERVEAAAGASVPEPEVGGSALVTSEVGGSALVTSKVGGAALVTSKVGGSALVTSEVGGSALVTSDLDVSLPVESAAARPASGPAQRRERPPAKHTMPEPVSINPEAAGPQPITGQQPPAAPTMPASRTSQARPLAAARQAVAVVPCDTHSPESARPGTQGTSETSSETRRRQRLDRGIRPRKRTTNDPVRAPPVTFDENDQPDKIASRARHILRAFTQSSESHTVQLPGQKKEVAIKRVRRSVCHRHESAW